MVALSTDYYGVCLVLQSYEIHNHQQRLAGRRFIGISTDWKCTRGSHGGRRRVCGKINQEVGEDSKKIQDRGERVVLSVQPGVIFGFSLVFTERVIWQFLALIIIYEQTSSGNIQLTVVFAVVCASYCVRLT